MSKITVTEIAGQTSGSDQNLVKLPSNNTLQVDNIVNRGGDNDSGVDLSSNDVVAFKTANAERVRVDANGLVGIGNTSPSSQLSGAANLVIGGTSDNDSGMTFVTSTSGQGLIHFSDATSGNARYDGFLGYEQNNRAMKFGTAQAERARINSSGNLGINTTSPVTKLHVNASANDLFTLERSGKSSGSGFAGFNIETNSQLTLAYDDGGEFVIGAASDPSTQSGFTEHFRIASNGTLTATDTSIGSNSDERLKKNIADYTYDLEKFKQYKPKTFDWKNPSNHNGKTGNRGFLAQDVKSIDDKWVGETEITEKNPDYGIISDNVSLTSKLGDKDTMYISVIQQLITKIETLEAKVKAG